MKNEVKNRLYPFTEFTRGKRASIHLNIGYFLAMSLLSLVVGACSAVSSNDDHTDNPALDPAAIEATSRAFFSSLLAGDIDAWLATLASDAVSYEPVGSPPNQGHEGLLAWASSLSGFESVAIELHDVFVADRSAAIPWTSTFTMPGGAAISVDGIDVHQFNDEGKIQVVKGYFDPRALMSPADDSGNGASEFLDPAEIEATSRAFFSSILAGDIDGWLATLAPDAVSHEPVGAPPNVGHEGLLAWASSLSGFESVDIELHAVHVAGNSAAMLWTSTFTPPGGEPIAIDGVDVHEYNAGGTIQLVLGYFDPGPLMPGN